MTEITKQILAQKMTKKWQQTKIKNLLTTATGKPLRENDFCVPKVATLFSLYAIEQYPEKLKTHSLKILSKSYKSKPD